MQAINQLNTGGLDYPPTTASWLAGFGGCGICLVAIALVVATLVPEVLSLSGRQFILIIGLIGVWHYCWAPGRLMGAAIYSYVRSPAYGAANRRRPKSTTTRPRLGKPWRRKTWVSTCR